MKMFKLNGVPAILLMGVLLIALLVTAYVLFSSFFAIILCIGGGYMGYTVSPILVHIITILYLVLTVVFANGKSK